MFDINGDFQVQFAKHKRKVYDENHIIIFLPQNQFSVNQFYLKSIKVIQNKTTEKNYNYN